VTLKGRERDGHGDSVRRTTKIFILIPTAHTRRKPDGSAHIVLLPRTSSLPTPRAPGFQDTISEPALAPRLDDSKSVNPVKPTFSPNGQRPPQPMPLHAPEGPPDPPAAHAAESVRIGIKFVGGPFGPAVAHMDPMGSARWSGRIDKGDVVTHVDGVSTLHMTVSDLVATVDKPGGKGSVELGIRRIRSDVLDSAFTLNLVKATTPQTQHSPPSPSPSSYRSDRPRSLAEASVVGGGEGVSESEAARRLGAILSFLKTCDGSSGVPAEIEGGGGGQDQKLTRMVYEGIRDIQRNLKSRKEQVALLSQQLQQAIEDQRAAESEGDAAVRRAIEAQEARFNAEREALEDEIEQTRARERQTLARLQQALAEMERLQHSADHSLEKEAELKEKMRRERDDEFAAALQLQAQRLDQEAKGKDSEVHLALEKAEAEIHKYAGLLEAKDRATKSIMAAKNGEIERLKELVQSTKLEGEVLREEARKNKEAAEEKERENAEHERAIAEMLEMEKEHVKTIQQLQQMQQEQKEKPKEQERTAGRSPTEEKFVDDSMEIPVEDIPVEPPVEQQREEEGLVDGGEEDGFVGGKAIWDALLSETEPVEGSIELFMFRGKVYRQPVYDKEWCIVASEDGQDILYRGYGVNAYGAGDEE